MPARVLKKPAAKAAAKKKSRSGKSGRSGWAAYRVQKENQRLAQENQINAFREYFNSEAPPLKKEQALVPVKQEELQAPPVLNEAFLAAALNGALRLAGRGDADTQELGKRAEECKFEDREDPTSVYQRLLPTGFPATSAISSGTVRGPGTVHISAPDSVPIIGQSCRQAWLCLYKTLI